MSGKCRRRLPSPTQPRPSVAIDISDATGRTGVSRLNDTSFVERPFGRDDGLRASVN